MATEKRLIDANALKDRFKLRIDWLEKDKHDEYATGIWDGCLYDAKLIDKAPTVVAFTEEHLTNILQMADELETRNQKLERELVWLKSCLNCKIRKECPRHCGKVVHGCDHWEYGDSAVDAVEVVHGRWIVDESGVIICSQCGAEHEWQDYRASFCEDCGTKMDEESKGDAHG